MATNNLTTEQVESTFVGINQIIKAIDSLKTKEEKKSEKEEGKDIKAEIKTKLESINKDFIKGSSIAPLYRLDKVKKALNLTLEQVDSIYDLANTRSATSIKNAIKKLEEQKTQIDKRIKKLKAELLK